MKTNNNQINNQNNPKVMGTTLICPHCGGHIALPEHEHFVQGIALAKDSNAGTVVLPAENGHTFGFKPRHTKADDYIEKMKSAGMDISSYFSVPSRNGGEDGVVMHYDDNGQPHVISDNEIESLIAQFGLDGYVKNTRLHRRYVFAHLWKMLNSERGFTSELNSFGYEYSWRTLLNEFKTMKQLQAKDEECFNERKVFFNNHTAAGMVADILNRFDREVKSAKEHKCGNKPYKKILGKNTFLCDIDERRKSIEVYLYKFTECELDYDKLVKLVIEFKSVRPTLNRGNNHSGCIAQSFKDAYKGSGAYYSLKNYLLFHDGYVTDDNGSALYGVAGLNYVKGLVKKYSYEYWRLFAFMKKTFKDNGFNLYQSIQEHKEV